MAKARLSNKLQHRRQARAFEHVLASASPNMRSELIAMAQRQNYSR
jgi:hypothetical protein